MNLPNKLTMARVIMIPFFVIFMLTGWGGEASKWISLAIFIVASLTDLLDGHIARKHNLVTNFGKFMDPLADKLLVCSAMICLVEMGRIPAWIVIVIISREFIISGFRLIASDNGRVIAASYWGKFKTTFQMVMICLMIANIEALSVLTTIVMWVALVLMTANRTRMKIMRVMVAFLQKMICSAANDWPWLGIRTCMWYSLCRTMPSLYCSRPCPGALPGLSLPCPARSWQSLLPRMDISQ